ncbi:MAG: T9SS type A sorting domain-containing protein [Bacteroidales bacterium]
MKRIFSVLLLLVSFTALAQPKIYTPTLASPLDNATNQMPDITLSWNAVTGMGLIKYKLAVDVNANFTHPSYFWTEFTTAVKMANLKYGTTYYWRVKAYDMGTGDSSYWSATRKFTTFSKLENKAPKNKDKNQAPVVNLEWKNMVGPNQLSGNSFFNYLLDTQNTFDSPDLFSGLVQGTKFKVPSPKLKFGTRYYWKVRAINEADTSDWSDVWYFRTLDTIKLKEPANNANPVQLDQKLAWDAYEGITKYDYELSVTPDFDEPLHFVTDKNIVVPTGITFGVKYYWRVRGRHAGDTSSWGETRSFTTIAYPILQTPSNGATNVSVQPEFTWKKMTGINFYQLQYDKDPSFPDGFISLNIGDTLTRYRSPYKLDENTTYYWRMRVSANGDTSQWSPAFSFTTQSGVGIDNPGADGFRIYPNPAKNHLSVVLPTGFAGIARIQILDLIGREVFGQNVNISGQPVRLDISGVNGGIFMLKVILPNKTYVQKLIIDR